MNNRDEYELQRIDELDALHELERLLYEVEGAYERAVLSADESMYDDEDE